MTKNRGKNQIIPFLFMNPGAPRCAPELNLLNPNLDVQPEVCDQFTWNPANPVPQPAKPLPPKLRVGFKG
jgi:hypothetical protein